MFVNRRWKILKLNSRSSLKFRTSFTVDLNMRIACFWSFWLRRMFTIFEEVNRFVDLNIQFLNTKIHWMISTEPNNYRYNVLFVIHILHISSTQNRLRTVPIICRLFGVFMASFWRLFGVFVGSFWRLYGVFLLWKIFWHWF